MKHERLTWVGNTLYYNLAMLCTIQEAVSLWVPRGGNLNVDLTQLSCFECECPFLPAMKDALPETCMASYWGRFNGKWIAMCGKCVQAAREHKPPEPPVLSEVAID